MINLDKICEELNEKLPTAGWPLRHKLRSLTPRSGARCASAAWTGPGDIGLQIYEREKSPVLIVFETDHSTGTIEPHDYTVDGIMAALNEYRWVVDDKC